MPPTSGSVLELQPSVFSGARRNFAPRSTAVESLPSSSSRSALQRWRESPWLGYIGPFVAFLLLQPLTDLFRDATNPDAAWWRAHPEHWVYPLQTLVALLLLAFWWPRSSFGPLRPGQILLATMLAVVGIAAWIAPAELGWRTLRGGFDPYALGNDPRLVAAIVTVRFLRLVLVASFIEEIFWRGFLQRYLVDTSEDFWKIPLGTFTWPSAIWTTVGVVLVHSQADWPAAAIWGVLVVVVYIRTRSLSACILMHAVANLLLGLYILRHQAWGLW